MNRRMLSALLGMLVFSTVLWWPGAVFAVIVSAMDLSGGAFLTTGPPGPPSWICSAT